MTREKFHGPDEAWSLVLEKKIADYPLAARK